MKSIINDKRKVITFDYSGAFNNISPSMMDELIAVSKSDFKTFVNEYKEVIAFYEYWKSKIEELEYRTKVEYTLSKVKNRETNPTILAKVKWKYNLNGKFSKTKYTSVHICSVSKYFKDIDSVDLKNPTLIIDAEQKIWEYLSRVSPIELMKLSGEIYRI